MRIILAFVCSFILLSCVCAQDLPYKTLIGNMRTEAETLKSLLDSNTMSYARYDKWYTNFKSLADQFEKDFSSAHKQDKSFELIRHACDNLSLAWTMLKQAEYADTQYKEFITTGDVGYAHKWKDEASTKHSDAIAKITDALELLKSAYDAAGSE